MTADNIIKIISSIATLSVSITIAIFTYQLSNAQKNIAKEKLKLDLFDRRYDLFKKIRHGFKLIMTTYNPNIIDHDKFADEMYICLQDIFFLLGEEAHDELHKIYKELEYFLTEKRNLSDLEADQGESPNDEEKEEIDILKKKREDLFLKMEENQERLRKIFTKYMSFEDFKIK
ncbi:MAG: hypothetical protein ABF508_09245 [Zymomonas mobilis]|uniref:hypothetical protein n=1 Tax=Zymomonas mobilis TaxID=542 RepID=UPI0039E9C2BF